jgi:hypothetical protein
MCAGSRTATRAAPPHSDELRALRRLQRETSPFVFVTTIALARMIERAPGVAGLELKAHGHAYGYALANKGHNTLPVESKCLRQRFG